MPERPGARREMREVAARLACGFFRVQQIDHAEREVGGIGREAFGAQAARVFEGARVRRAGGQLPKERELALVLHPFGGFGDDGEHAADARFVADRAVGKGEEALFEITVAIERNELVVQRHGFARARLLEQWADVVPCLGEDLLRRTPERGRVLGRAEHRPIAVVIEEVELRPPGDDHGELRIEHHADRGAQALRPGLRRAERGAAPVFGPHQRAEMAASGKEAGSRTADAGW